MAHFVAEPGWRETVDEYKRQVLSQVVGQVQEIAKRLAPVDTGHLRESISSIIEGDIGTVMATADYALFVEEGHRIAYRGADGEVHYTGGVVPPQPFLRPALYSVTVERD